MPCYHPLHAFDVGEKHPSGKPKYHILGTDDEKYFYQGRVYTNYIEIPCGQCIGCRLEYSRQWAMRCLLESKYHDHNCFITLTYDNEHLPPCWQELDDDGVVVKQSEVHSLVKSDFQAFMKRFRQRLVDDYIREHPDANKEDYPQIRFFACGEYGAKNLRPHYHAIIFGFDFPDRKVFSQNFRGESYFRSPLLESLWPFGFSTVCNFSWDCCAYVARYMLKKHKGYSSKIYVDYMFQPEFTLMSRKPGLARQYYDEHKDQIYKYDSFFMNDGNTVLRLRPPKYYDRLFDIDDHDLMEDIKADRRSKAETVSQFKDDEVSVSHNERLEAEEQKIIHHSKILKERSFKHETFI